MEKEIKSVNLTKYLSRRTNKETLNEDDLEKVTRVVINFEHLEIDEKKQIFDDLKLLPNLKDLSLVGLDIDLEDIKKINSLNSLVFVTFDFCTIDSDLIGDFRYLVLNICKGLNSKKIIMYNLKELKIIDSSEEIDVKDILECKNLENLYLLNSKVTNILEVRNLSNLKKINLSGTPISDDDIKLLSEQYEVIHEEEYHPTGL